MFFCGIVCESELIQNIEARYVFIIIRSVNSSNMLHIFIIIIAAKLVQREYIPPIY